MLQEKASAVTDGCVSQVQTGGETDLLPDQSQLDPSTAPTTPVSSEPDQVHKETRQSAVFSQETVELYFLILNKIVTFCQQGRQSAAAV